MASRANRGFERRTNPHQVPSLTSFRIRSANVSMRSDPVPSPVTGGATRVVDAFDVAAIIDRYRRDWNLDVADHFAGRTSIYLYQCEETGYRFFHPQSLAG